MTLRELQDHRQSWIHCLFDCTLSASVLDNRKIKRAFSCSYPLAWNQFFLNIDFFASTCLIKMLDNVTKAVKSPIQVFFWVDVINTHVQVLDGWPVLLPLTSNCHLIDKKWSVSLSWDRSTWEPREHKIKSTAEIDLDPNLHCK